MPRTARAVEGGGIYHVLNRGNGRIQIFHKPEDFQAFVKLLSEARAKAAAVDVLGLENSKGTFRELKGENSKGTFIIRELKGDIRELKGDIHN